MKIERNHGARPGWSKKGDDYFMAEWAKWSSPPTLAKATPGWYLDTLSYSIRL